MPTRPRSTFSRPTSSRAQPSTSTRWSAWPRHSRTAAMPMPPPRATSITASPRFPTTGVCRETRWRTCAPVTGATSSPTSTTMPISRSGSPPARAACSSGRRAAGATAFRAGTSSARPCRCATSDRSSISIPAASITSSRTTRTRSRSPNRLAVTCRRGSGSTASSS